MCLYLIFLTKLIEFAYMLFYMVEFFNSNFFFSLICFDTAKKIMMLQLTRESLIVLIDKFSGHFLSQSGTMEAAVSN